jgi:tetratricopeptide (TPR) repeat protein
MIPRQRTSLLLLVLAIGTVAVVFAQKAPPPAPPSSNPRGPTITQPPTTQTPPLTGPSDLVLFIHGKVTMDDGSSLPNDILVDRVCNGQTRQQVHTDRTGNFNFDLSSRYVQMAEDVSVSAQPGAMSTGNPGSDYSVNGQMGVNRQALWACEIKAEGSGLRSAVANLSSYSPGQTIDVGTIYLQRGEKVPGTTISATSYQAPKDAKKAYEKGLDAAKKGHFDDAQKQLEKAVQIYPQYATAWHQLGNIYERQNQTGPARKAYEQAIAADPRFVPPYLSMATIAAREGNWKDVLTMTQRGLDLDPLNYPAAYYFNSLANYRLNNLQAAEKGARSAEHYDQQHRIPQIHLLLATILSDSRAYAEAVTEFTAFLKLAPDSKDADAVRAKLASVEKLAAKTTTDQ